MPKVYEAVAQYFAIPMGMGLYYSLVWQYAWKPLLQKRKSTYQGEIGSSDSDDPFTQEEKIGYISKGKEDRSQKERERQRDNEREREYYDTEYTQEQERRDYQEYYDSKMDILFSAGYGR